jgi:hypothetical protein
VLFSVLVRRVDQDGTSPSGRRAEGRVIASQRQERRDQGRRMPASTSNRLSYLRPFPASSTGPGGTLSCEIEDGQCSSLNNDLSTLVIGRWSGTNVVRYVGGILEGMAGQRPGASQTCLLRSRCCGEWTVSPR